MHDHLRRWWSIAEGWAAAISRTDTDAAASDAEFKALLADSAIVRGPRAAGDALRRAWRHSWCRSLVSRFDAIADSDLAARVRVGSWLAMIAAITVLLLEATRPSRLGPLSWLLPVVDASTAGAVFLAAEPIARALRNRS